MEDSPLSPSPCLYRNSKLNLLARQQIPTVPTLLLRKKRKNTHHASWGSHLLHLSLTPHQLFSQRKSNEKYNMMTIF
jgi:hypothetical protein